MAYKIYDKLWFSQFFNKVSAKDGVQDINLNELKLKVNDIYKNDEKTTTSLEPSNDEDYVNRANLDAKLVELKCHKSYIQKM